MGKQKKQEREPSNLGNLYDEVQEEIETENQINEILNGNSPFYDNSAPIINLLIDSEYGKIGREMKNSLDYLRDRYIGCGNNGTFDDSSFKEQISKEAIDLFGGYFLGHLVNKYVLNGNSKKVNELSRNYRDFFVEYKSLENSGEKMKNKKDLIRRIFSKGNNSRFPKTEENMLFSMKKVSGWVSGEDVKEIKSYLDLMILSFKNKFNAEFFNIQDLSEILINNRISNLERDYKSHFSEFKGSYNEFPLLINFVENVLETPSVFGFSFPNETLSNFEKLVEDSYFKIKENKNIADFLIKEADKEALRIKNLIKSRYSTGICYKYLPSSNS